jgi:UDP-N-acetylglucosamine--N-acetylmuramyl-(pentapeptide) pyrophosphoryl-undecaprenol N-acetylglucosamine transferase
MKVVIAGGGTAGHVNPALALAGTLTTDDVTFVGTDRGVEARLVPEAGLPLETIEVSGFDRARPWAFPIVATRAARAVWQARKLLVQLQPDAVVGMGGYVSLPVCAAARLRGVPAVIHEQNIVLGLANKTCKPLVRRVAVSFEETLEDTGDKGVFTGNPVLPVFVTTGRDAARAEGLKRFELDEDRKTLLVFGGSLGAQRINDAALGLARLWSDRSDLQVVHICGRAQEEPLRARMEEVEGPLIYRLVPYVAEMVEAYAVADLALCRGGATTVAELCVFGVPSIIVPYPFHRDRQQERHGRVLEKHGAARVLMDADTHAESVARVTEELLRDEGALASMSRSARALGRPDAASALADVVHEVAR